MYAISSLGPQGTEIIFCTEKPTQHTIAENISSKFSGTLIPKPYVA